MNTIIVIFIIGLLYGCINYVYEREKYRRWLIKAIYYTSKEDMDKINKYIKLKGGYLTVSTLEDIIHGKHNK